MGQILESVLKGEADEGVFGDVELATGFFDFGSEVGLGGDIHALVASQDDALGLGELVLDVFELRDVFLVRHDV